MGPPRREDRDSEDKCDSCYQLSCNGGKKSMTPDISRPQSQEVVRALASRCDVLIETYKVGTPAQYGFELRTEVPRKPGRAPGFSCALSTSEHLLMRAQLTIGTNSKARLVSERIPKVQVIAGRCRCNASPLRGKRPGAKARLLYSLQYLLMAKNTSATVKNKIQPDQPQNRTGLTPRSGRTLPSPDECRIE